MLTNSKHSRGSSAALALCLILGATFLTSCGRSTESDDTKKSDSPPVPAGSFLRADPNPIMEGNPDGKTTITWDTDSAEVGEVFVVSGGKETLFATGPKGSQEADWIKPGSTEFRLYTKAGHKLLAQMKVTMSPSEIPPSSLSLKPASSPSPH